VLAACIVRRRIDPLVLMVCASAYVAYVAFIVLAR
jgi:hypothetical protein